MLGYDYQKLIALEYCLNAKKNEHIWIECKGDVADSSTSVEVKHHIGNSNITSNSVDVWKTLKNYVTETAVETFSSLILHTTSISQGKSIFYNWNSLSSDKKREKLIKHVPADTIKEDYDLVRKYNKKKLEKILDKFQILEGQPDAQKKWDELKDHHTFKIIPEKYRVAALEKLYGYITKKAIENSNEWKININDFNKDIQDFLSQYTKDKTPFPVVDESDPAIKKDNKKFKFLEKMKAVNIKDTFQNKAITDYLRANISQIKLLEITPTLLENLSLYDNNIIRMLEDEKGGKICNLNKDTWEIEKANLLSNNLYFDCIGKPHDPIIGVNDTQKYYRDGRIHNTLEETEFAWKINKDEL